MVSEQSNGMILSPKHQPCMPSDSALTIPMDASCDNSMIGSLLLCNKRREISVDIKSEPLKKNNEMIEGDGSTRYSKGAIDNKPLESLRSRVNK